MTDATLWVILSGSSLALSLAAFTVAASAKADTRWVRQQLDAAMNRNAKRQASDEHRIATNGNSGT